MLKFPAIFLSPETAHCKVNMTAEALYAEFVRCMVTLGHVGAKLQFPGRLAVPWQATSRTRSDTNGLGGAQSLKKYF